MAWLIGDSFDFYAAIADAAAGHWDVSTGWSLSATTRFSAGQSLQGSTAVTYLSKAIGSNEATLYAALAHYYNYTSLTGTNAAIALQFLDGTTAQCTVVFETSGNIVLKSGGTSGTVLATYSGAFALSTWAHFQIKVVIHNTSGSITIRKNGDPSDTWSATGLNTRGGTANNYANKVAVVCGNSTFASYNFFDDLLFYSASGAAPNTWIGDVRAVQLRPSADTAQRDFSRCERFAE